MQKSSHSMVTSWHCLWTSCDHSCFDNIASSTAFMLPAIFTAIFSTCGTHSSLGLPCFRTYLSIAGLKEPGQNDDCLSRLSWGARAALPISSSCSLTSKCVRGFCRVLSMTLALLIRDKYAGWIPQSWRRHLQCNPLSNLRSDT